MCLMKATEKHPCGFKLEAGEMEGHLTACSCKKKGKKTKKVKQQP